MTEVALRRPAPSRNSRPTGKSPSRAKTCPALFAKIFFFVFDPNHLLIKAIPCPMRGAFRDRHERWAAGSGGRGCAFDERRVTRTAKSCGPDAPMAGVKFAMMFCITRATVTSKLWSHRGEHEISCKTIAQGRPDCFR